MLRKNGAVAREASWSATTASEYGRGTAPPGGAPVPSNGWWGLSTPAWTRTRTGAPPAYPIERGVQGGRDGDAGGPGNVPGDRCRQGPVGCGRGTERAVLARAQHRGGLAGAGDRPGGGAGPADRARGERRVRGRGGGGARCRRADPGGGQSRGHAAVCPECGHTGQNRPDRRGAAGALCRAHV